MFKLIDNILLNQLVKKICKFTLLMTLIYIIGLIIIVIFCSVNNNCVTINVIVYFTLLFLLAYIILFIYICCIECDLPREYVNTVINYKITV